MATSVAIGLAGIALAFVFYVLRPGLAEKVSTGFGSLYRVVYNKYFIDEIYDAAIIQPTVRGSRLLLWRVLDVHLIDSFVNGIGARARDLGHMLAWVQSGNIRSYAAWVLLGSVGVLVAAQFLGVVR